MLTRVGLVLIVGAIIAIAGCAILTRRAPQPAQADAPAPGLSASDREACAHALERAGIQNANRVAALAEPSVRITTRRIASAALPLGASRFGGVPDVSAGFEWPMRSGKPLVFLAQIDLSELSAPALPSTGWLLFFYDAAAQPWGFDPKDAGSSRVIYLDVAREELKRAEHPKVDGMEEPFELTGLTFHPAIDLPDSSDSLLEAHRLEIAQEHTDAYAKVAARLAGVEDTDSQYHHLLGHPQLVQNDMRGECQLVTNGIYDGDATAYQSSRAQALLRTAPGEWRLLLQIDTDEEGPGWMWGDTGRIYFWIRHEDLAAGRFDKTWLILQCA